MEYAECKMNVAVNYGGGEVRLFGWATNGFRPLIDTVFKETEVESINFVSDYNEKQRESMKKSVR